jgi:hypothetical protein
LTQIAAYTITATAINSFVSGQEQVFSTASGTLDFFFLVSNTNTGDPLKTIDLFDALGWGTVSVAADGPPPSGGQAPSGADQSASGQTVNFDYLSSGAGTLTGKSEWLEIDTSATSAVSQAGAFGVIDGGAESIAAFVPTPEPATTSIVGGAVALMALMARRRRARKS